MTTLEQVARYPWPLLASTGLFWVGWSRNKASARWGADDAERPVDADVARFVGDAVLLSGELHDGCVCCALGRLPVYSGALRSGPVTVLIRPEQVLLNAEPGGVEARVLGVTYHGHDATVRLAPSAASGLELLARMVGYALPTVGEVVTLTVRGEVVVFGQDPTRPSIL